MDEQTKQNEQEPINGEELIICNKIDSSICGELLTLSQNKAEIFFVPTESMVCDEEFIHAGFVFNAAAYAALCAINKKNSIIIGSETKFLAPIELGYELVFKANALQSEAKKCEVKVEGFLFDIKVFDSIFYVAIFDRKLFKLKLKDEKGS
ncbi:thioesterase [Helicobacter sp. 12S02232-10]|uniref:thioesterase n=1 Tax=Helicobacter sp. 12S02232-10 TaxID=1476197 RepID=UPI000BA629A6|nr:thioesterase [Helicobacter sp. 12S02232-10]PAF49544.1 thioesterase [Helicobacter sp. 12S02232-10]